MMTEMTRFGRIAATAPRRLRLGAAAVATMVVFATAGCAGGSSVAPRASAPDDRTGPAVRTFRQSELLSPATLAELGALSDLVVEARVEAISRGPSMSDGEGLAYLVLELVVTRGFKGAQRGDKVEVLSIGYDPKDGAVYTGEGEHRAEVGAIGFWYLGSVENEELRGYTYPRTSAGQILKTTAGLAETGGDQQAAAVLCGVPWEQARSQVEDSVVASKNTEPLAVGEPSPFADPAFAGNPCAAQRTDEPEAQPTVREGE